MRTSLSPVLSRLAGKGDGELVLLSLVRLAEDRGVARAGRQRLLERLPIDVHTQLGRTCAVRVDQIELEPAFARGWESLQPEENDERVRSSARPAVHRAGVNVGPVVLRVRTADDEQRVIS